jgi:YidC/Oxa1 family membrane protein insertase
MENFRFALAVSLAFILVMMYQAWQKDYGQPQTPVTAVTPPNSTSSTPNVANNDRETPQIIRTQPETPHHLSSEANQRLLASKQRVLVETDVFKLEIDTVGGDVRLLNLRQYSRSTEDATPIRLLNDQMPDIFVAQSGLLSDSQSISHETVYQAEKSHYQLADNAQTLDVLLTYQANGLLVKKIFHFQRGSYTVNISHHVENQSTANWQGRLYGQLQRNMPSSGGSRFLYTYTGGAISTPEKRYQKVTFDEISKAGADARIAKDGSLVANTQDNWQNGWIALLQHYFVSALVPEKTEAYNYYSKTLSKGQRYVLGLYSEPHTIKAGQTQDFNFQFYTGPKSQHTLENLASGLELTVDYGWLWFIAQPLFWLLEAIHSLLGNWGWAIIILTLLIKLAFFQLSATSYKSMANMRRLQPRLLALKERYANDRMGLNQAMMDIYKKEKINPLGGCLPILVQIPVFISLYWMLLESVELRQAPFMLWIDDLSVADPYFVLPLIMGVSMFIQQKLNPAPLDPLQQKVMMTLPFVFTVFFAFFPAGLVLYWVINNILSIAQQWYITHKIAGANASAT